MLCVPPPISPARTVSPLKEQASKGKNGLEEHDTLEDALDDARPFVPAPLWPEAPARGWRTVEGA